MGRRTDPEELSSVSLHSCLGVVAKAAQLRPTLYDPTGCSLQAPLSMGFSRQEHWSGLPQAPPHDIPNPGIDSGLLLCRRVLHPLSHQGSPSLLSTPGHFSGGKINSSFPNLLPFRDKLPNTPISALHSSSLLGTDANSAKASALTLLCVLSSQRMA